MYTPTPMDTTKVVLNDEILAQSVLELKNDKQKLANISEKCGQNAKTNALSEICRIIMSLVVA